MHVLGTGVPSCSGVARSASSPKATQALGCSLTPGLWILFGRVTCMAQAASVPGLWTMGFLLLCGACVWVWVVLGLGSRLRPAPAGWRVGVCVCLCARSACTPPLMARVCGVGVCVWAQVSAAPRFSWLRCWGACVLVCALCLYPAIPGCGARRWCVCLGSGFGCVPPLLAGVLGRVCACVRAPLVPCHSWLGCAAWVCVLGLGFRLRPATPGWGVGVCVCLCAPSACTPPVLARLCCVRACSWAWLSATPRHSWQGCWAVCVLVCVLRLYSTTPISGVRCVCVCLGLGLGCAPPLLAGVLGCVSVCVRAPLVPRHSWLACAVWVCVLGLGSRLRPGSPGWVVGVCVCLCARSACTPPLLARVCGVGVCACARVSAAPRHSWLWCWAVCVLVCALRLYPATPGLGVRCGYVCLGLGLGCAPPLLAGLLGCVCACVRVRAPLVPHHSWPGCALWVCVLGLGFRLRPATPGWDVGGCVCFCARSACTPPLLAVACGGAVCAWARVLAAPRHSWLGCRAVCVLVCALRLYPTTPGWGVRRGCVCLGSSLGCAPPLLAGVLGCLCACVRAPHVPPNSWLGCAALVCVPGVGFGLRPATPGWAVGVCVFVCALRLYAATPGWAVRCGCVCLGSGFGSAPPLLAGVLGCGCVRVRALLVPRHSWLACALWVCVLGLGSRLRPAISVWGVGFSVRLCARSCCTPPLLSGVRGVGVCASAWVSAAPCHSGLGCWGVCVCVRALPVPCNSWLGFFGVWVGCFLAPFPVLSFVACWARCPGLRHPVAVVAWHLFLCLGCGRRRASVACLMAPFWCVTPHPVRLLSVLWSAFLTPWCLSPSRGPTPPDLRGGCAGHVEADRELGSWCLPLAPAEAEALGSLPVVPIWCPAMGFALAGPSGVGLGRRELPWFVSVDPVTDASSFWYHPSFDGGLGRCNGAVSCGRRHCLFQVGGRHAWVPRLCACACPSWPGRASWPPGRFLVRLTFSCGRSLCALCVLGPLWVGVALFVVVVWFFFPFPFPVAPPLSPAFRVFRPGVPWALASCGPPARLPLFCFWFFSAPAVSGVPCFPARDALGLGVLWSSAPPPGLLLFSFCFFCLRPLVSGVPWFRRP